MRLRRLSSDLMRSPYQLLRYLQIVSGTPAGSSWSRAVRALLFLCGLAATCGAEPHVAKATAVGTEVFYATSSGKTAMDKDAAGGNPFATALIDILARPQFLLEDLPRELMTLTLKYSKQSQSPEVAKREAWPTLRLVPAGKGERWIALVLIVSHYDSLRSLPGALFDANRVARTLKEAGFETQVALNLDLEEARHFLSKFAETSAGADLALIYSTGHGVEISGKSYLLPRDFSQDYGQAEASARAITVDEIGAALQAKSANLLFFGGCRNNPWQKP